MSTHPPVLGLQVGTRPRRRAGDPTDVIDDRAPHDTKPRPCRRASGVLALAAAFALCAVVMASAAPPALAHAQLLETSPQAGSTVHQQPAQVIFEFNEAVSGTPGAVRVYDAGGAEVDDLHVVHPGGHQHWMAVGLQPHLRDGTYTATYRVISADTHIVYGGLVFNLGHRGATPRFTVAGLIGRNRSGELTGIAFGVVRGLDYLSIALLVGGVVFLLLAWLPALATATDEQSGWESASTVFQRRLRRLLLTAVALGLLVSVLGIALQGASAAGLSLWRSLDGSVLRSTLESRFGLVWGLRAIDWLMLGALIAFARSSPHGTPVPAGAPRWLTDRRLLAPFAVGMMYLAVTPALAGHASVQSPVAVMLVSDVLHVLAASVWVGGVACLLLVLPAATRSLAGPERSRLLLATLARFSPLALAAVLAITLSGALQAYIDVRSLNALLHTTYGLLILVKVALLLALVGLGWTNRRRVIPGLERLVDMRRPPGGAGLLARRTLRGELALMLAVLAATAALVGNMLPVDADSGPFAANTTLGPLELELTVDPARAGSNAIHLYLIDATSGTQFTGSEELEVTADLPSKQIGPLPLHSNLAGPGHYVLNSAVLSPSGEWRLQITDRVSEFDQYSRTVKVPIR